MAKHKVNEHKRHQSQRDSRKYSLQFERTEFNKARRREAHEARIEQARIKREAEANDPFRFSGICAAWINEAARGAEPPNTMKRWRSSSPSSTGNGCSISRD